MKVFLSALLFLSCGVGVATAQELPGSDGLLATDKQLAEIYAQGEQWQELEALGREWSAKDGSNWESWYYYGTALFKQGKQQEAAQILTPAVRLSRRDNQPLILLYADLQASLGEWRESEIYYRRLVALNDSRSDIWNKLLGVVNQQLATVSILTEQHRELSTLYAKVLTFGGHVNNEQYWREYAGLLERLGDAAGARDSYHHVLRLNPRDLAIAEKVFRYDRDNDDAERLAKSEEHLLRLSPNHPIVNLELAKRFLQEDNKSRAMRYYTIVSENQHYPYERAEALASLGDLAKEQDKSLSYYRQAVLSDPSYTPPFKGIITILRHRDEKELADAYYDALRAIERRLNEGGPVTRDLINGVLEDLHKP